MEDCTGDTFKAVERVLKGAVSKVLSEYGNRQDVLPRGQPSASGLGPSVDHRRSRPSSHEGCTSTGPSTSGFRARRKRERESSPDTDLSDYSHRPPVPKRQKKG